MKQEKITIDIANNPMKCIVLKPKKIKGPLPGILWIHGGSYALGLAGMVHMLRGKLLAKNMVQTSRQAKKKLCQIYASWNEINK